MWIIQQARLQRRGGLGAASPREHQGSEFCRSTLERIVRSQMRVFRQSDRRWSDGYV